jgi:NADH-quinone oxidoreductase subunit H
LIPSVAIAQLVIVGFVFVVLLSAAAGMVYMERKVAARIQQRMGPTLVGPYGLLQPLADIIKLAMKEDTRPKPPIRSSSRSPPSSPPPPPFTAFAVVPFGAATDFFGLLDQPVPLQIADVNVAILWVFAVASMGVYGIVLAGWSSNSKYSLLGALRSSAQMISYELSYGLALAAVLVLAGSMSIREIVDAQAGPGLGSSRAGSSSSSRSGFFIFMTAGVAETNRRRSIFRKPSRSSSPAITPSTAA